MIASKGPIENHRTGCKRGIYSKMTNITKNAVFGENKSRNEFREDNLSDRYPVMTPLEIETFVSSAAFIFTIYLIHGEESCDMNVINKHRENPIFNMEWERLVEAHKDLTQS